MALTDEIDDRPPGALLWSPDGAANRIA